MNEKKISLVKQMRTNITKAIEYKNDDDDDDQPIIYWPIVLGSWLQSRIDGAHLFRVFFFSLGLRRTIVDRVDGQEVICALVSLWYQFERKIAV